MTLLIIIGLILFALSYYFSEKVIKIKTYTEEEIIDMQMKEGHISKEDLESNDYEVITLESSRGYKINGRLYLSNNDNNQVIVISHGVTVSKYASLKYMKLFRALGYDCLLIDHCRHGESGGKYTSMGYYEKLDLSTWVDFLKDTHKYESIGIHGESMGSAITLMYIGMKESKADFAIVDCPFDTLWGQLTYRLKIENHLPAFPLLHLASLVTFFRAGFRFSRVSPIKAIETATCPILFIHSKDDRYIPCEMTKGMFESYSGEKSLYIAENGGHAEALKMNKEVYTKEVASFLKGIKK